VEIGRAAEPCVVSRSDRRASEIQRPDPSSGLALTTLGLLRVLFSFNGRTAAIQTALLVLEQIIELLNQFQEPGMIFFLRDLFTQSEHSLLFVRGHAKWGAGTGEMVRTVKLVYLPISTTSNLDPG
jgi:hypothetical protein